MARIGHVPEIIEVKNRLADLQRQGVIKAWELPYENLLTRLTAAIFFVDPAEDGNIENAWDRLSDMPHFRQRKNEEKKLSVLEYRIEFNKGDEAL